MSEAAARAALDAQSPVFAQCLEAARAHDPAFAVELRFVLAHEHGVVVRADVVGGRVPATGLDPELDCLRLAARRLVVPAGAPAQVRWALRAGRVPRHDARYRAPPTAVPTLRLGRVDCPCRRARSSAEIARAIATRRSVVRACYERELLRTPTFGGRVVVELVIAPNGAVSAARVASTSFGKPAPRLENCLVGTLSEVAFPAQAGATSVVRYPLLFKRTSQRGSTLAERAAARPD